MASAPPVVPGQLSPDRRYMWDGSRWVPAHAQGRRSRVWLWALGGCATVLVLAVAGLGLWVYSFVQGLEHGSNICLPAEFPRYPAAINVSFAYELNGTYPGNTCDVVLESNDGVDTVVAFYESKLNTGAWQVTSRGKPSDQVTFQAASSFAPFGTVKVAVKSARTDITIDVFTSTCLPLGFPQHPSAVFGAMSTESTSVHRTCDVVLESNDDVASVTAFYVRELNTGSWRVTSSASGKVGFLLRGLGREPQLPERSRSRWSASGPRSRSTAQSDLTTIPGQREGLNMWETAVAEATLPAKDLERARIFYVDRLGLSVHSEDETGVHFVVGGSRFRLFRSSGSATGSHTQLALMVRDIAGQVEALRARGVSFEEYDYPTLKTVDGIADLGYARAAWLKDSEGNLLGIAQLKPI